MLRVEFVWPLANLKASLRLRPSATKSNRSGGYTAVTMTTHTPSTPAAPLLALPDDVLQRVLVGVPLDDHCTTALVCRTFRAVVTSPQFHAARRRSGFAERGIVVVGSEDSSSSGMRIRIVNKSGVVASLSGPLHVDNFSSTTDGARLFFTTLRHGRGCGVVLVVDASSRRWRQFTTLPRADTEQRFHCVEWHNGCLYVAGGWVEGGHLDSLDVFNEATGSWANLPPMPHAATMAASGIIGNQLFVAGGYQLRTLQVYDIATRTWTLRAQLPEDRAYGTLGVVLDGKLFLIHSRFRTLVYDPQADTWTMETYHTPWNWGGSEREFHACVHEGQIVVFLMDGSAFKRAADGSWSSYRPRGHYQIRNEDTIVCESVLLG